MVERFPIAGCGFLLAVLWFDLMFDTQALTAPEGVLGESVLASIATYYARVTTGANPMGRLVGVVMIATLAAIALQLWRARLPRTPVAFSLGLVLLPVTLAALRILPNAMRLGTRVDTPEVQSALARSIAWEHCLCLLAIAAALALQLHLAGPAPAHPADAATAR